MDALSGKAPASNQCCQTIRTKCRCRRETLRRCLPMMWRGCGALTGKPSVLAIWAGRRDVVTPEIVADFLASKEYGVSRAREIAEAASHQARPAGSANLKALFDRKHRL